MEPKNVYSRAYHAEKRRLEALGYDAEACKDFVGPHYSACEFCFRAPLGTLIGRVVVVARVPQEGARAVGLAARQAM